MGVDWSQDFLEPDPQRTVVVLPVKSLLHFYIESIVNIHKDFHFCSLKLPATKVEKSIINRKEYEFIKYNKYRA